MRPAGQVGARLAADVHIEAGCAPRVGHRLAFGAAHQHRVAMRVADEGGEHRGVFGVGVVHDSHRRAERPERARRQHLGDRVPRIAQADDAAHLEQAGERRAQVARGDENRVASRPGVFDLGGVACDRQAEVVKDLAGGHAARVVHRAVHQHVGTFLRQQQGEQRREVRELARAVVRRQHDGRKRRPNRDAARVRGGQEAGELVDRFALDAHREHEGAEFEVADAAVEHLAHQVVRLGLGERACAFLAAADFFDVLRDRHA